MPLATIASALAELYPSKFERVADPDRYAHRLAYNQKKTGAIISDIDKVKVAKIVARSDAVLSELDLNRRMTQLIEFIRKSTR